MAKPFRPKRNTTAKIDEFTGKPYEITLDCERQELRIHDGLNAGGFPTARAADLKTAVRLSHTQYKKGDIVACPDRNDVVLECVQAGQTANRYVYFKNIIGGAAVTDGSVIWQLKIPYVKTINGVEVDRYGNIDIESSSGGVQTINGQSPDENGNIEPSQLGCLPLSGGTVDGEIVFTGESAMARDLDSSCLTIAGGTAKKTNGASLTLYGKDSVTSGSFVLEASNGRSRASLQGTADGTLIWQSKPLVRKINGKDANWDGSIEVQSMPELSALPYKDEVTIQDGQTYEYEMKDDGLVTLNCSAGTGRRYYSGIDSESGISWYEYRDEGNTTLQVTVNGLDVYPSKTAKGTQSYSERFFLKKGRKISVYCKRSYKYNVIEHSFSINVVPHA